MPALPQHDLERGVACGESTSECLAQDALESAGIGLAQLMSSVAEKLAFSYYRPPRLDGSLIRIGLGRVVRSNTTAARVTSSTAIVIMKALRGSKTKSHWQHSRHGPVDIGIIPQSAEETARMKIAGWPIRAGPT